MRGLQKRFLIALRQSWSLEFPFLKETTARGFSKLPAFVCDRYFAERRRKYFLLINFSNKRLGRFYLEIVVDDDVSFLDSRGKPPGPLQIGMFRMNCFEGKRQDEGWHLTGLKEIELEVLDRRINQVICELNAKLRTLVFPRLEIDCSAP